jgi:two-component system sensor histidine kinase MtrB
MSRAPDGPRRLPLGLRARITVGFSLLGLLLSLGLAVVTFTLTSNYLVGQRREAAEAQAFANARAALTYLRTGDTPEPFMEGLRTDGFALLVTRGQIYTSNAGFDVKKLPSALVERVSAGDTGRQRADIDGKPYLVFGVTVAAVGARYYEAFSLAQLDSSVRFIASAVAVSASVATLAAAGIGLWASRRVLRPLTQVAEAASDLASGGLDTRLRADRDPDLHRLTASFNEMADALQTRIEREARFASDVSHELRSPLTALTAAVEVLDGRREELPPRSQQALDVVVSQVSRFDQMVLDLLEISRLDAGAAELHVEEIMVPPFLQRVVARHGHGHVPLEIDPALDDEPVALDRRRLERIVANLLQNADHHAGGAVRITVRLRRHADGAVLRLAVEDAGPGVAPAEQVRIFERFARGTAARHRVGTGLGLALVAEHARLHGGTAWVEDRGGGGARFVVELGLGRAS